MSKANNITIKKNFDWNFFVFRDKIATVRQNIVPIVTLIQKHVAFERYF